MLHNVNHTYNRFLEIFTGFYGKAFPKRKLRIKQKTLNSPWMTKGLQKSSKRKQKLYYKYLKNELNKQMNYINNASHFTRQQRKNLKNFTILN